MSILALFLEAWAGIEPARVGFADRSVTTSPPRPTMSSTRTFYVSVSSESIF